MGKLLLFPPPRPDAPSEALLFHQLGPPRAPFEQLDEAKSFWSYDSDGAESIKGTDTHRSNSKSCVKLPVLGCWASGKRRYVIVAVIVIVILAFGAILGGVLGGIAARNAAAGSHMPELPGNNSGYGGNDREISIHPSSQLASASVNNSISSFKLLVFYDVNLELVVTEWRGSEVDTYLLKHHMKDQAPPRLSQGTPFCLVSFGQDNDMHLFYLDQDRRLIHLVRQLGETNKAIWKTRMFVTHGGGKDAQITSDLRLSAAVFPASNTKDDVDGFLGVLYHTGGARSVTLATNPYPGGADTWSSSTFALYGEDIAARPAQSPRALMMMPSNAALPGKRPGKAIRVLWDQSDDDIRTTFGMMDCLMDKNAEVTNMCSSRGGWKDEADRERLSSASKPLQLSKSAIPSMLRDDSGSFPLAILDGGGKLVELFWDGSKWSEYKAFSVMGSQDFDMDTFSSVSITEDGSLFVVSGGKLLNFKRVGNWWERKGSDSGWLFVGAVNVTMAIATR